MGSPATAWRRALATLAVVAGLDQATKAIAVASLAPGEARRLLPGLELALTRNTGVAFGALSDVGPALVVALTVAAGLILVAYFARRPDRPLLWLAVGMVLGGAVGNLIDRARYGAVTDFVDPTFWPAFNLADAAIVLGVASVLYLAEARGGHRLAAGEPGGRG